MLIVRHLLQKRGSIFLCDLCDYLLLANKLYGNPKWLILLCYIRSICYVYSICYDTINYKKGEVSINRHQQPYKK